MSAPLVGLAVAVVAGGVLALSARDGRVAVVGLLAALALAPLVGSGAPDPAAAGARIAAAVLASYLVRRELAAGPATQGSRIGWPAEALGAAAAFLAGLAAHEASMPGLGATEATAAGFALAALAAAPLLERSDVLREGIGLALAITGADLVRVGLAGPPSPLESIVVAVAVALVGAAVALLHERARRETTEVAHVHAPPGGAST